MRATNSRAGDGKGRRGTLRRSVPRGSGVLGSRGARTFWKRGIDVPEKPQKLRTGTPLVTGQSDAHGGRHRGTWAVTEMRKDRQGCQPPRVPAAAVVTIRVSFPALENAGARVTQGGPAARRQR